jgi:hypothetical protein
MEYACKGPAGSWTDLVSAQDIGRILKGRPPIRHDYRGILDIISWQAAALIRGWLFTVHLRFSQSVCRDATV